MERESLTDEPMTGVVVTDETYVGGNQARMNFKTRAGRNDKDLKHKIPVVTMIEKHSGEARSRVMTNVTSANLEQMFKENADSAQSLLWTDSAKPL